MCISNLVKEVLEVKLELGSCNAAQACFSVWLVFFPTSTHEKNASFVLVGVAAQHRAGGPVPWSTGATCWHFIPWCLQHKHSSPRFSSLGFPLVWLDRHAFHYRVQHQSEHTERQSIFLFSSRSKKKKVLLECISTCQVLYFRIFFCNYCFMHHPGAVWRSAFCCHAFQLMISMH